MGALFLALFTTSQPSHSLLFPTESSSQRAWQLYKGGNCTSKKRPGEKGYGGVLGKKGRTNQKVAPYDNI